MKLYLELLKAILNKFIIRKNTGEVVLNFCENMGIVYIKFAQILATQNFGQLFCEKDRIALASICDDSKPISFEEIKLIIEKEYGCKISDIFDVIDVKPCGSASISQVHKATLKTGEVVAVKIKRLDITKKIEKDINQIKKLIHRFGKLFKFENLIGSDHALELYLQWIHEEINFENEKENIKRYDEFAKSINGKVKNNKLIKTPCVYDDLCTENIIVMEYVDFPTINKIPLAEENKEKIRVAINSYIVSCFYALFHGQKVTFHGDPHNGNIYIDKNGNIGFLDMGLIFSFTEKEAELIKNLFLSAYSGKSEDLYNLIIENSTYNKFDEKSLKEDLARHVKTMHKTGVTTFFVKMIFIFTSYDVTPPDVTFKLAKAFLCLYGIVCFTDNIETTEELLKKQIIEFFVERTINDTKETLISGLTIGPRMLDSIFKYGLEKGIVKESGSLDDFNQKFIKSLKNCREVIDLYISEFEISKDNHKSNFTK